MSSEMRRDARRIIKLASLGVAALGVSALGYALAKSLDLQRDTSDDEA